VEEKTKPATHPISPVAKTDDNIKSGVKMILIKVYNKTLSPHFPKTKPTSPLPGAQNLESKNNNQMGTKHKSRIRVNIVFN